MRWITAPRSVSSAKTCLPESANTTTLRACSPHWLHTKIVNHRPRQPDNLPAADLDEQLKGSIALPADNTVDVRVVYRDVSVHVVPLGHNDVCERSLGWPMTADWDRPARDRIAPPGTWLADVPRDTTLEVVALINIGVKALEYARNTLLLGVDGNGEQPGPGQTRVDTTAQTAERVIETVDDLACVIDAIRRGVLAASTAV